MDRIKNIWQQIENQPTESPGLLKVLYSTEIAAELYLGLLTSHQQRCLLLRVKTNSLKSFPTNRNLKGLKIEKISDPEKQDYAFINLILLSQNNYEIFDILIQDIINKLSVISNEKQILQLFYNRIDTWRMLFEKTNDKTLSPEGQQGLYGELYFLRKWLVNNAENNGRCIQAWLGPNQELRDFQSGSWALEVKTTKANNHQKIQISSERQLDTSNLTTLWLYVLSLEVQYQNGETLNQLVDSLLEILKINPVIETEFRTKLLQVGYFIQHRSFYEDYGYQIRQQAFYIVKEGFPRIEESLVPQGVGDVKYSIILSNCNPYIIKESAVFEKIV